MIESLVIAATLLGFPAPCTMAHDAIVLDSTGHDSMVLDLSTNPMISMEAPVTAPAHPTFGSGSFPTGGTGDPWFAEDKAKHFAMAFAATGFMYGIARTVGLDRDAALVTAALATVAAGAGKELHDRRRGGRFSSRDMAWNLIGIAAGLVLVANTR